MLTILSVTVVLRGLISERPCTNCGLQHFAHSSL